VEQHARWRHRNSALWRALSCKSAASSLRLSLVSNAVEAAARSSRANYCHLSPHPRARVVSFTNKSDRKSLGHAVHVQIVTNTQCGRRVDVQPQKLSVVESVERIQFGVILLGFDEPLQEMQGAKISQNSAECLEIVRDCDAGCSIASDTAGFRRICCVRLTCHISCLRTTTIRP
jgi:hypothetical protein